MSNITDTVDTGAMTHSMRLVIPERFCSADISSEGNAQGLLRYSMRSTLTIKQSTKVAEVEEHQAHTIKPSLHHEGVLPSSHHVQFGDAHFMS